MPAQFTPAQLQACRISTAIYGSLKADSPADEADFWRGLGESLAGLRAACKGDDAQAFRELCSEIDEQRLAAEKDNEELCATAASDRATLQAIKADTWRAL